MRNQGDVARQSGNDGMALTCYQQALTWVQTLGHSLFVASCLPVIALILEAKGYNQAATCLVGAAVALYPLDSLLIDNLIEDPHIQRTIDVIRSRLDDPIFAAAWAEGQAMTVDEAIAYALTLSTSY